MNVTMKTFATAAALVFALALTPLVATGPAQAAGTIAARTVLRVSPSCVVLGQRTIVRITMVGLHPWEKVSFSGPPRQLVPSGNLGIYRASRSGTISFRFRYTPVSSSQIQRYGVEAWRHQRNPSYPQPAYSNGWSVAATGSLRVVLHRAQCR